MDFGDFHIPNQAYLSHQKREETSAGLNISPTTFLEPIYYPPYGTGFNHNQVNDLDVSASHEVFNNQMSFSTNRHISW